VNNDGQNQEPERASVNAARRPTPSGNEPLPPKADKRLVPVSHGQRRKLLIKYSDQIRQNPQLTRALVSFQASKGCPFDLWFKYREEAFSPELVRQLLNECGPGTRARRRVLDPFAGIGTTITTASQEVGWKAVGIELLPVGEAVVRARLAAEKVSIQHFRDAVAQVKAGTYTLLSGDYVFRHMAITQPAFPPETQTLSKRSSPLHGQCRTRP
jgi:hypothetical protein